MQTIDALPDDIERVERDQYDALFALRVHRYLPFQAMGELIGAIAEHRLCEGGIIRQIGGVDKA